jgi:hypothetical protein
MCSLGDLAPRDAEVVHVTAPTDATDCGGALFVVADAKDDEQAATISIDC